MPKGKPYKRYTPEFKQEVIETMQREKLGYRETAQRFGVARSRVTDWERIYLEQGPEGFRIDRRKSGLTGRPPRSLPPKVEEDLLAEVQRLRAENAYLKKLQALVLERERLQGKKPR